MARIPIVKIPGVLKQRYGRAVSYQKIWTAVAAARIPAEQLKNGRWQADPEDVAELYDLREVAV